MLCGFSFFKESMLPNFIYFRNVIEYLNQGFFKKTSKLANKGNIALLKHGDY
jgi:hypothetical protein